MDLPSSAFVEPRWNAPLDLARSLGAIPADATIAGMFFLALSEGSQRRQVELGFPRSRYLKFGFYPVRELAPLLVEAAQKFYPRMSVREGLRRIGRVAPAALLQSTVGKVTLGVAEGVLAAVSAIAKTYGIYVRPSRCQVTRALPGSIVVSLDEVPHFLDSHHVGVFEGTLEFANAPGDVRIHRRGERSADLLLTW